MRPTPRTISAVLLLSGAIAAGTVVASAATTGPQQAVSSALIVRQPGTLASGSRIRSNALGQRVFTDARHGFALASTGQAQYPAASTDGGKTWRTIGPALHLDAAQGPLAVTDIGVANRRTIFAYGSGQAIDTTSDGGKHWYRALFQGLPMAVVPDALGHLAAFVDASSSSSSTAGVTLQYVSKNGGRTWRLDRTVGGS